MYDHVLVPTDDSETSRRAVDHAVSLASEFGATVHGLSVVESTGTSQRDQLRADLEDEARAAVDVVEEAAAGAGLECTTTVREGPPAEEIRDHMAQYEFDLIVVGTENRTGLDRVLDHSVAEDILEHSIVPVLTVPGPE
ncbi:universal stress protein [Halovivax limisalsi]|uniref:universal stress protein n=1 Tax=Halovivax limisalsi TaxID=1453760 RepID=UPI001FFC9FF8|nr:universal stress protein [Halovivax limisalsi]